MARTLKQVRIRVETLEKVRDLLQRLLTAEPLVFELLLNEFLTLLAKLMGKKSFTRKEREWLVGTIYAVLDKKKRAEAAKKSPKRKPRAQTPAQKSTVRLALDVLGSAFTVGVPPTAAKELADRLKTPAKPKLAPAQKKEVDETLSFGRKILHWAGTTFPRRYPPPGEELISIKMTNPMAAAITRYQESVAGHPQLYMKFPTIAPIVGATFAVAEGARAVVRQAAAREEAKMKDWPKKIQDLTKDQVQIDWSAFGLGPRQF